MEGLGACVCLGLYIIHHSSYLHSGSDVSWFPVLYVVVIVAGLWFASIPAKRLGQAL